MKQIIKLLIVNLVVFGLFLLLFELGIRVIAPQNLRSDPEGSHVAFGFSFRPKPSFEQVVKRAERIVTWKINSHGLRDNEIAYEKGEGVYRVVGLGDSFTFGFHVEQEETFLHQLEERLNADVELDDPTRQREFQTLNMGVGGYGIAASYHLLVEEGLKYTPDMVVTSVFVGNDIGDTLREHRELQKTSSMQERSNAVSWVYDEAGKPLSWKIRKYLGSHLHSYVFLTTRLHKLMVKLRLKKIEESTIDILRIQENEPVRRGWETLKAYLTEIQGVATANGAHHVVVIIPMRHQVEIAEWRLIAEAYNLNPNDFEIDRPQVILREFLSEEGIDSIDLLPILREAQVNAYFEKDPHFNPEGHRLAAMAIHRHIGSHADLLRTSSSSH